MTVKKMMGLPPGVTTTFSASTGMLRVSDTSSAIRARRSGMPGDGT